MCGRREGRRKVGRRGSWEVWEERRERVAEGEVWEGSEKGESRRAWEGMREKQEEWKGRKASERSEGKV